MIRTDRRIRLLAASLSALAGYVDAIGFLKTGGFFVSFMSGNSTRAAVGLAEGSTNALIACALIFVFVVGVILGSSVGHLAGPHRKPAVLGLVAALLAVAAMSGVVHLSEGGIACMVLAMGAENAVFARDGEVHIGLTYMTGTLVKLGQHITHAFFGGHRTAWVAYLLLWLGLVAGAVCGALIYPHLGLSALWIGAAAAAIAAVVAHRIDAVSSPP
jgi:uncharacterized membrane protein YoaK (UPF0700 family)